MRVCIFTILVVPRNRRVADLWRFFTSNRRAPDAEPGPSLYLAEDDWFQGLTSSGMSPLPHNIPVDPIEEDDTYVDIPGRRHHLAVARAS